MCVVQIVYIVLIYHINNIWFVLSLQIGIIDFSAVLILHLGGCFQFPF